MFSIAMIKCIFLYFDNMINYINLEFMILMRVKESEKAGLKLNIQKTKIMASSPITSWQIDGATMETVTDFILGGCQNH